MSMRLNTPLVLWTRIQNVYGLTVVDQIILIIRLSRYFV